MTAANAGGSGVSAWNSQASVAEIVPAPAALPRPSAPRKKLADGGPRLRRPRQTELPPSRPPSDRAERTEIVVHRPTDPPPRAEAKSEGSTVVIAERPRTRTVVMDRPPPDEGTTVMALPIAEAKAPPAAEPLPEASTLASGVRPRALEPAQDVPGSLRGSLMPPPPRAWSSAMSVMLRGDELTRAQHMLRFMAVASALGAVAVALGGLSSVLRQAATSALVAWCGVSVWLCVVMSLFGNISRWQHLTAGVAAISALVVTMALSGPQSVLVAALAVLVAYHAASGRRFEAWAGFGLSSAGVAGLAVAGAAGILDAPMNAAGWLSVAIAEAALAAALWLGMTRTREQARERLREHNRIARREALLDEAHAQLELWQREKPGALSGTHIAGCRVGALLGCGARGEVYAARDPSGDEVAIKVLHQGSSQIGRVFRDALAAASVSPLAVSVHRHGVLDSGSSYLVTERVLGSDLAGILHERGPLHRSELLSMVDRLADALAAVHAAGVVHGNLRPSNVLRERNGRWRIVDFGTAALPSSASARMPRYVAPELLAGGSVDARADVFSLAALAYRALTSCPAFCGADPFESGASGLAVRPARPSDIANVHPDVDRVMALALSSDPNARVESVQAFAGALRDALAGELSDWLRVRADALIRVEPWAH